MNLNEMMLEHKFDELKAIYRFIYEASAEDCARIIEEIRCVHDNILVFNKKEKSLDRVESVEMNGEAIQLIIEE
jgi:hypothetical protein